MNSGFSGRWDRNRTCTLRFWSLLPFVQERSGTYTTGLKIAHFGALKYQEVPQRSPALGSTLGSNYGNETSFVHTNLQPVLVRREVRTNLKSLISLMEFLSELNLVTA
jgi:hypothetical protein